MIYEKKTGDDRIVVQEINTLIFFRIFSRDQVRFYGYIPFPISQILATRFTDIHKEIRRVRKVSGIDLFETHGMIPVNGYHLNITAKCGLLWYELFQDNFNKVFLQLGNEVATMTGIFPYRFATDLGELINQCVNDTLDRIAKSEQQ